MKKPESLGKPDLKVVVADQVNEPNDSMEEGGDGRRQRSERSRAQIVEALFALIREGDMNPSAASVATRAGVGLRTVFRHFEDMDSLYREMSSQLEAEILPIVMSQFKSTEWRGRLNELIARRAGIYEHIMPMKVASSLRRYQSSFLMDDYKRFVQLERAGLKGILPDELINDRILFSALEMLTGFQTWLRMRQDQDLKPAEAAAVIQRTVDCLLADK